MHASVILDNMKRKVYVHENMEKSISFRKIPHKLHLALKMYCAANNITERQVILECFYCRGKDYLEHVNVPWPEGFDPDSLECSELMPGKKK